jgi:histone-binding protein RBBP4
VKKKERVQVDQQIVHSGEVNKARYMPQSHNLVATKTISGEVHLWDMFKHPSKPVNNSAEV